MKMLLIVFAIIIAVPNTEAQFLKKLKQKAENAVDKTVDKTIDKKVDGSEEKKGETGQQSSEEKSSSSATASDKKDLKVYSKFDFVPASTILYYDNFEKDNIGETPSGWITTTSAEVVTIEGLEGNWLKLASTNARHIIRSKKQSWGNNFTVEFDLLIVKKDYDPRIDFALINTSGKLVTDETILQGSKNAVYVGTILGDGGKKARVSLYNNNNINNPISDRMSDELLYENNVPVHVSMCVQGKRFRFWWNEKKIFDMQAVSDEYLPNQFGFSFGNVGGCDYYATNFRVAKDVPDTRAKFEQGKIVSNLLFYTGTANLKPESMGALLDVSKVLKEATDAVKIIGHTDSDGDDASNQKLSQERADAVKTILVKQYGIDESKITVEGRGETQPITENKSAEGKAQNRRVEFIFKPEADVYTKPAGTSDTKAAAGDKAVSSKTSSQGIASSGTDVKLQSKLLNINLPYAMFMKTGENTYTFTASKEEGNSKENYFTLQLETVNMKLRPETFNFKEVNEKNPLYGTKKFSEIKNTEAVFYYGGATKPYIHKFSPIIANGHMATYVSESLERKLPAVSPNCKLVIEKVEDARASGYFVFGLMNKGLKPITKGDAMTETFTDGFAGEVKCTFTNVPVN